MTSAATEELGNKLLVHLGTVAAAVFDTPEMQTLRDSLNELGRHYEAAKEAGPEWEMVSIGTRIQELIRELQRTFLNLFDQTMEY